MQEGTGNSTFWHKGKQALLVVYVDDFKLASRKEHTKVIWEEIRSDLELSEPESPDRFLGCYLTVTKEPISQVKEFLHSHPQYTQKVEGVVTRTPFDGDTEATVVGSIFVS